MAGDSPNATLFVGLLVSAAGAGAVSAQKAVAVAPPDAPTLACDILEPGAPLPDDVRETSGLARGLRDPSRFWTHNDAGNEPVLFALDEAGRAVARVRIEGAELVDWEDIEAGPCDGASCLWLADTGDNDGDRDRITVYAVEEPGPDAATARPVRALHARYPDGPRDAEALFVDRAENLFLITKGRHGPIALYRFPDAAGAGEVGTLERVRQLFPEPADEADRVTAATMSPDGRRVAVLTYRRLYLFPAAELLGGKDVQPVAFDLGGLRGSKAEAVALAEDGSVWLSSEGENSGERPLWARLRCDV